MAASIRTINDEDFEEKPDDRSICKICYKELAKYTCPRCNIRYCSSECYKTEGHAACSETFYKNCFMEGLKECEASSDEKQKMTEMLQRLENEDFPDMMDSDDDEEDGISLEERMHGLNLDGDTDKIWEKLTDSERKEFQAMVEDGRFGNMMELWEPWWNVKEANLVQEIGKSETKLSHPPILKKVPDLTKLLKGDAPDSLKHDITNILYSYAYTIRLHNGDYEGMELQAADTVLRLSDVLAGKNFTDTQSALHACFQAIQNHKSVLGNSPDYSVAILKDVENIVCGPNSHNPVLYVQAALSDLHKIFKVARKELQEDLNKLTLNVKTTKQLQSEKQRLFNSMKKLEFLLAWMKKHGHSLLSTIPEIEVEFCMISTDLATQKLSQDTLKDFKSNKQKEKLIQEFPADASATCYRQSKGVSDKKVTFSDGLDTSDNSKGKKCKVRDAKVMGTSIDELD